MAINWNTYKASYDKPYRVPKSKPEPKPKQEHTFKIGDIAQIINSHYEYRVGRYIKITDTGHSKTGLPLIYFEYLEHNEELEKEELFPKPFSIATYKLRFVA